VPRNPVDLFDARAHPAVAAAFAAGATATDPPTRAASCSARGTGFDPQAVSDLYSNYVNRVLFEPLFATTFARPHRSFPTPQPRCRLGGRQGMDDRVSPASSSTIAFREQRG
jgi:hypothetical protein